MTKARVCEAMIKINIDLLVALSKVNIAAMAGDVPDMREAVDQLERRAMDASVQLREASV